MLMPTFWFCDVGRDISAAASQGAGQEQEMCRHRS